MHHRNRHLVKKGTKWYFHIGVPTLLRQRIGKSTISKSLGTGDIRTARERRDQLLPEIRQWFAELSGEPQSWNPTALAQELRVRVLSNELPAHQAHTGLQDAIWDRAMSVDPEQLELVGEDGSRALRSVRILEEP